MFSIVKRAISFAVVDDFPKLAVLARRVLDHLIVAVAPGREAHQLPSVVIVTNRKCVLGLGVDRGVPLSPFAYVFEKQAMVNRFQIQGTHLDGVRHNDEICVRT